MKIVTLFVAGIFLLNAPQSFAQTTAAESPSYHIKLGGYLLFNGGFTLSAGIGYWKRFSWIQPGSNLSVNGVFHRNNLGNRSRKKTNWQLNTVISPLLTFNLGGTRTALYEEINPFYLGNAGAIYSDYRSSATIGSSFVVMPKGLGKNIATARNRSQQLIYVQLRGGWNKINSVTLNLYEDFLFTDNGALQGWADNWDRFYTGGGNLQVRLSEQFKVKLYSEIYTGFAYRELFDYPDLIQSPNDDAKRKRYAYQDAGQQAYNKGRTLLALEYSPTQLFFGSIDQPNLPTQKFNTYQFYIGKQGGQNMWSQNAIHSLSKIPSVRAEADPDKFHRDRKSLQHMHFFKPVTKDKFVFGMGMDYGFK